MSPLPRPLEPGGVPASGAEEPTVGSPPDAPGPSLAALLGASAPSTTPPAPSLEGPVDLIGADLSGRDLRGVDLRGARLVGCDLRGACLEDADLAGADLSGSDLGGVRAARVDLKRADLTGARLEGADLTDARLTEATLRDLRAHGVTLTGACLSRSDLRGADVSRSEAAGARLYGARVDHADFERTNLRGAFLGGLRGFRTAEWLNVDVRDIDHQGTHLARRHITDENYIAEFRRQGPLARAVWTLWWLTSDCGRSITRWGLLTTTLMLAFAEAYALVDVDYGPYETWLSPIYLSVVTMTSLGYGDVIPATAGAQLLTMVEVVTGYVLLGGLMSIFSTKMARRAD